MYFVLFALLLSANAAVAADPCKNPANSEDVLLCLEKNYPDMKKTAFDEKQAEGVKSALTQFPNPTLDFETLKGDKQGDVVGETKFTLSQLIEIGGKRSARRKLADAEVAAIKASSTLAKYDVKGESMLAFMRYRQLLDEVGVLKEALETYEKVDRQYSARPRLSPDQQVSLSIFKLAIGDYRHRLATLQAEIRNLESFFKLVPELSFNEAIKYLPKRRTTWPKFEAKNSLQASPSVKEAEAQFKKAEASYDLASANAWPDATVGLITSREVEGTLEWQNYGVSVTLPLPFWNLNGGEKKQTYAEKEKASIEVKKRTLGIELERDALIKSYQEFVEALNKAPAPKDIDKKHRSTESLFYQGVISGALVIEAHRQILDFTQTQNELELETTKALIRLYVLDGRLEELKYE